MDYVIPDSIKKTLMDGIGETLLANEYVVERGSLLSSFDITVQGGDNVAVSFKQAGSYFNTKDFGWLIMSLSNSETTKMKIKFQWRNCETGRLRNKEAYAIDSIDTKKLLDKVKKMVERSQYNKEVRDSYTVHRDKIQSELQAVFPDATESGYVIPGNMGVKILHVKDDQWSADIKVQKRGTLEELKVEIESLLN